MAKTRLTRKVLQLIRLASLAERRRIGSNQLIEIHEEAISRRAAVKRSLQAAAALPLAGLWMQEAMAQDLEQLTKRIHAKMRTRRISSEEPVIIIGAGTAGLTAAYRLIQAGIPCEIYEGSRRVGGRMYSQRDFNSEGMFCERGGELVDTDHEDLIGLCKEVGLEIQSLAETDASIEKELYFIGGRVYRQAELLRAFQPLAVAINADLQKIYGAQDVETPTYSKPYNCEAFDRMTLREYLYSKSGVDRWVLDLVNVCYTGEYGLETESQSAMNLIAQIDVAATDDVHLLGESDECKRIKGGNGSLPERLAELIRDYVPIHYGHDFVRIQDGGGTRLRLTFQTEGRAVEVSARQLVSAIPFTTLRNVEGILDLGLSPRKKKAIRTLGYGTNAKLMTGYKDRFWRKPLPPQLKSNGLVYTDTSSQELWETSRGQAGTSGIITSFLGGLNGQKVSADSLALTIGNIERVFPGARSQFDSNKVLQHWPSYKYTLGSYICPLPGQYVEMIGNTGEPELGGRFRFAGEHTSVDFAGFMNGAVQSGNRVAKEIVEARRAGVAAPVGAGAVAE